MTLPRSLGSAWMVIAAIFFSIMGVLVKYASEHYSFLELVFYRTAFSVVFLGAMVAWQRKSLATPYLLLHIGRGFAGTMGLLCFFFGLAYLPLSTATTLNYTSPIFLAILSFVLYQEKISKQMGISLILGFIGVVVLLQPTLQDGQLFAALIAVMAGAFGGWAYVQVKDLTSKGEPEWRIVFYFSVVSTVIAGVLSTIGGWHAIEFADVGYLLGIGITALIAQISMTRAYKVGRKFVVASLSYLTVVFATVLGVLLFHDVVTWQEILGMAVIVASGLLSSIQKKKPVLAKQ